MLGAKVVGERLLRSHSTHKRAWNRQPGATASGAKSADLVDFLE